MRTRGACAARAGLFVCLVIAVPTIAAAQEAPPYDPNVDVQLFEYQIGPKTYFSVDDGAIASDKQIAMDVMVTFLKNPFTVYNVSDDEETVEGERTQVVQTMLAGEISGAYGLKDRYQIGVALPLVFSMSGQNLMPETAGPGTDELQISGLGDLRAEIKAHIWKQNTMRLAGAVGLTLPSSFGAGGDDYLGDDLPSFRGRVAWNYLASNGKLSLGANAGLILRKPRTIYASEVGQQFTWGAAAAFAVTPKFSLIGEGFGRSGMTAPFDLDSSPMEAGGGLRIVATKSLSITLGGSAGVLAGIGSPDLRVFASVGYSPDTRDTDGDGVPNNRDSCMIVMEDPDGHEDGDGCPDDDNDGDRRSDLEDQCKDQAEDFDGFEDDDGCPELDNDGDGIEDLADRFCPLDKEDGAPPQATDGCPAGMRDTDSDGLYDPADGCYEDEEDQDGFEDWDGCPDLDQDKDGVADEEDRCPVCTEDKDGFDDGDGCPEGDNDLDGIPDAKDGCASEAEVVNGINDWDGCPDDGGAEVASFEDDRLTFRAPVTFDKKGLTKAGKVILDQAALLMLQHPEVTRWTIAVSAKKDAAIRGEWIAKHVIDRGVASSRIDVVSGKGSDNVAIAVAERAEVDDEAPPMCPAGAEVSERQAPGGNDAKAPEPEPQPEEDDLELE